MAQRHPLVEVGHAVQAPPGRREPGTDVTGSLQAHRKTSFGGLTVALGEGLGGGFGLVPEDIRGSQVGDQHDGQPGSGGAGLVEGRRQRRLGGLPAAEQDVAQPLDGGQVPLVLRRHQRNAKLFLTAQLGPFEHVDGLYSIRDLFPRPRRRAQWPAE